MSSWGRCFFYNLTDIVLIHGEKLNLFIDKPAETFSFFFFLLSFKWMAFQRPRLHYWKYCQGFFFTALGTCSSKPTDAKLKYETGKIMSDGLLMAGWWGYMWTFLHYHDTSTISLCILYLWSIGDPSVQSEGGPYSFCVCQHNKKHYVTEWWESEHQEAQQMLLLVVQSHSRSLSNPLSQTNTDTHAHTNSQLDYCI